MVMDIWPNAVIVVGSTYFWLHCAEPVLRATDAPRAARRVVFWVTAFVVAAFALDAAAYLTEIGEDVVRPLAQLAGPLWTIVVALGFLQDYKFLIRLGAKLDAQSVPEAK